MQTEDGRIIYQCLNGEPEMFGMLVDKYKAGIYAYIYSKVQDFHEAQDLTQEAFFQAYRSLPNLKRWESFTFWLTRIAYNVCRDWKRKKARQVDQEFIEDQELATIEKPSFDSFRKDMMDESLKDALNSLSESYREVLVLYYFTGMDSVEIARALGTSPQNIRQRLNRARATLKEDMIIMMGEAFKEHKLQASFTFRIVEAIKKIKIHPLSNSNELPWGLSLATGIMMAVLFFNQNLSLLINFGIPKASFPSDMKILKAGDYPVDVVKAIDTEFAMGLQEGENKKNSIKPDKQNVILDPQVEFGKWEQKADMPTARSCATAEVDGKIYAIGGTNDPNDATQLSTVEVYDSKTDTWMERADMPTPRMYLSASAVNGKIYAIGGSSGIPGSDIKLLTTVEEYDPKTDTWTKKANTAIPRNSFTSAVVNGKIYIMGGGWADMIVEEYDPAIDKWTRKTDMPTGRWLLGSAVINNKIYAIGGSVNPGWEAYTVATVEEYDPALDRWTKKADMPLDRSGMSVIALDDKIYVIAGGKYAKGVSNTPNLVVYVYDPMTDQWSQKMNKPIIRALSSINVVDGKIYLIGGLSFEGYLSIVEEYTP